MAKNLSTLIEDVYVELGIDHLQSKPFNRRMVGRMINSGIGVLSSAGINGRWWQSDAVTLVAGTTSYTYTPPAHTDHALLTTTLKGISAVARDTDGMALPIWTPDQVWLALGAPSAVGPPQAVAFHVTGEATSLDTNRNSLKVLVYPEPGAADLPCHLDFRIATIQSMRFEEYDTSWEIDYSDGAEMALVLVVASELAARSDDFKAMAPGFGARAGALIQDEARRLYSLELAGDISQVEG